MYMHACEQLSLDIDIDDIDTDIWDHMENFLPSQT